MPKPKSKAYYNEIDPFCCQWLRNLIDEGLIANGDVDERSIADVIPDELLGYTQCHFFAGIGSWSYALRLADWPDDRPVWTGSCPCQPFSTAGNGGGTYDPRHLWPVWERLIAQRRPPVVFGEQVATAIGHGWWDIVSSGLESEGYACGAAVLGAHSVGAPHIRQRLYWMADSEGERLEGRWCEDIGGGGKGSLAERRLDGGFGDSGVLGFWSNCDWLPCRDGKLRPIEPELSRWLMGFPREWDDCVPTEMPSSRKLRRNS